jgi:predicted ABC-type exoprotein transport system permease subunit
MYHSQKWRLVMQRLTFLSHFVLCLACAALAFFAWRAGAIMTIWQNDASMMTSVIAVLFVGTAVWLGWQAWLADGPGVFYLDWANRAQKHFDRIDVSSDFGHLAERLAVMAGFVGTAIGLSLQAKSLAGGATSFTALATSLFTTASGGTAAALIALMTFNLEAGIRRGRK